MALADRTAIFDHGALNTPNTAAEQDDRIGRAIGRLSQFPHSGRAGRTPGTHELVIARTPYIAAYRIAGDLVIVLRILHGARRWPDEMA